MDTVSKGVIGAISIRNIGGISENRVELAHGVNVLSGQNATNRTSFLKALAAAQGSENVALKGDEQSGSVELTLDGDSYTREIRAVDDSLVFTGSCPVAEEDRDTAELFAFLFERNRAREAIRNGADLRDVVMDPVDTAVIQEEIATLQERRSRQERELEELRSLQQSLPSLQERRDELAEQIERLEADISETEAAIERADSTVDEQTDEKAELDSKVSTLRARESELETVRSKIETTEQSISQLETDRSDAQSELESLATVDQSELDDVRTELSRLHEQLAHKESMMTELRNVIQFNEDFIAEGETNDEPASILSTAQADASVTESLVDGSDDLVCWTCGTKTTRTQISETLERLQSVHEDLYGEREHLKGRIEETKEQKDDLESARERRENLEETVSDLTDQIERNRETLSRLQSEEAELTEQIDAVESDIEVLRQTHEDRVLDKHQQLNNLEHDLAEATDEYESVTQELADVREEVNRIDAIEASIDDLTDQIVELRQHADRIEHKAITEFNDRMEDILAQLDYRNIERIWMERQEVSEPDGRGTEQQRRFELHVVRESPDGSPYEDTVGNLSESEREVTGLIFALAGYLVHDVHEVVPFMLLDSLEAIDSERIALLIEYLREYADNIAVALLEEDAAALDDDYHWVTGLARTN